MLMFQCSMPRENHHACLPHALHSLWHLAWPVLQVRTCGPSAATVSHASCPDLTVQLLDRQAAAAAQRGGRVDARGNDGERKKYSLFTCIVYVFHNCLHLSSEWRLLTTAGTYLRKKEEKKKKKKQPAPGEPPAKADSAEAGAEAGAGVDEGGLDEHSDSDADSLDDDDDLGSGSGSDILGDD